MVEVIALAPKKEVTCSTCKSRLSYAYTDITFKMESDYSGDRERVARIKCPVCNDNPSVPLFYR